MSTVTVASWTAQAACLDDDLDKYFPMPGDGAAEARAKCAGCKVRTDCLDFALERGIEYGVWGGFTAKQRTTMRRRMRR